MRHAWLPVPPLPPAHAAALDEALHELDRRQDLLAVVLAGSVARGGGGPTSDLDLYCLIDRPVRQRQHMVAAGGVLVEMFFNPVPQVRRYFAEERSGQAGGPSTAHMLATGHILLDQAPGELAALRDEARQLLAEGPDTLPAAARDLLAYRLRDLYEDCVDAPREPALAECLLAAVELHYRLRRRWLPKMKDADADLRRWDAAAAGLLAAYAAAPGLAALGAFVAHVLADDGGLPIRTWATPEEPVGS